MSREAARHIAVCVPDNCGRLVGKRLPTSRLEEATDPGMPMPNFHLVTGLDNAPLRTLAVSGPHTGFPNGRLRIDPATRFRVPGEAETDYFIADAHAWDGRLAEEAPRTILRRQLARLEAAGLAATMASELEFHLYEGPARALAARDYADLAPVPHRQGDNDPLVTALAAPFLDPLLVDLEEAGVPVDQVQGEGGAGQLEVNVAPAGPLAAADRHAVFKHVVKARAALGGHAVTFMAKPTDGSTGAGGHIHLCLTDVAGTPLMREGETPTGGAAAFLAGVLAHTGGLVVLHAPYANSFRRLRPGAFTPLNASWAVDNRTVMVRLTGSGRSARLEFRLPGADANPYLSYAALLAAGLAGVEEGLPLPPPVAGDAGEADLPRLPRDLTEALAAFEASAVARSAFGPAVHGHLAGLARAELDTVRGLVTDWDRRRAFETA